MHAICKSTVALLTCRYLEHVNFRISSIKSDDANSTGLNIDNRFINLTILCSMYLYNIWYPFVNFSILYALC